MKVLTHLHVVQFSFWDWETFNFLPGGTGVAGANGAGKTSLVDAIQIAMVGAHGKHMHFNAQSVHKDSRTLRDYALGAMRSGEGQAQVVTRKRDRALSYITLVFQNESNPKDVCSAGVCVYSTADDKGHQVKGLYVLPDVALTLEDHLESLSEGRKAPQDWEVFDARIRSLAKAAGRRPTITGKPEEYIREFLHSVQSPGLTIDMQRFLRNFSHSLDLKHVSSVGDFLRRYLVEAAPIDKQGTLRHIRSLQDLIRQIEECEAQIVRLQDIDKKFARVESAFRKRAIARAVEADLRVESEDSNVARLVDEIDSLNTQIETDTRDQGLLQDRVNTLRNQIEELVAAIARDPLAQGSEQSRREKIAAEQILKGKQADLGRLVERLHRGLNSVVVMLQKFGTQDFAVQAQLQALSEAMKQDVELPVFAWKQSYDCLSQVAQQVRQLAQDKVVAEREAKLRLGECEARVKATRSGERHLDSDVVRAMAEFQSRGIGARTVASLVQIKDPAWQVAIESFLGRNRHALVVDADREREAVRALRETRIPEVTVVQPQHLKDDIGRTPAVHSVATLLQSDHPVALTFLSRILGSMRMVETEEELERHPRALTRDCMLSANGGTRRLRPLSPEQLVIGVGADAAMLAQARQEERAAKEAYTKASFDLDMAETARKGLEAALEECTPQSYELIVSELGRARSAHDSLVHVSQDDMPDHLKAMKATEAGARREFDLAQGEFQDLVVRLGGARERLVAKRAERSNAELRLADYVQRSSQARADAFYDADEANKLYSQLDQSDPVRTLGDLRDRQIAATRQIDHETPAALADFCTYLDGYAEQAIEERSDWEKAMLYGRNRLKRLQDSQLVDYKQQAEDAKAAAEAAFRSDVKFKIRELFHRVDQEIRDLNAIMVTCPPFTGGEKYRFVKSPSPTYRDLYELIQADGEENESLFQQEKTHDLLMTLLDSCEKGDGKGTNPLEDYRLFFNFDLEIQVDGQTVDYLSKRMGVGSNGEHRVPFYVIAAASLANAYRMGPGKPHQGVAVMLLDEAFYGVDAQNTFSVAEFMRSMGLQLIMAYPDTDIPKLTTVVDSYYEVTRWGPDIFAEHVVVKAPAKRLMLSDIPEQNPLLIDFKVTELEMSSNSEV